VPSSINDSRHRVLLVHATGNANVRQSALALLEADLFAGFCTTFAWNPESFLTRILPRHLNSELNRRAFFGIPFNRIYTYPWNEVVRLAAGRLGYPMLYSGERALFGVDAIYQRLDRRVTADLRRGKRFNPKPTALYSYDDCAYHCFHEGRHQGLKLIYELPTVYHRSLVNIIQEERELNPEWINAWIGSNDSPEKLARKDEEIRSADAIFVASSYCAKTLKLFPEELHAPVYTINYGSPSVGLERALTSRDQPLRILYVGSMNQRKGISYLFQAVEQLTVNYKLTLIGGMSAIYKTKILTDALAKYTWVDSAPHSEVLRMMRQHDVLVFPTLSDAFGLVIPEAMAQGTVVITTPHSAAPDIIESGVNGFIVPIRDADSITAHLTHLSEDRSYLATVGEAARRSAQQRSWAKYRSEWATAIAECLGR
jgi:glycosyltransferase involved in cell wall biosynthesis